MQPGTGFTEVCCWFGNPAGALWGSWAHEAFRVPQVLFSGNNMTFPELQREGMRRPGRSRQETQQSSLGAGPGSSSQNIPNSIFQPFCRTKTPNEWKNYSMKHLHSGKKEDPQNQPRGPKTPALRKIQTCLYPEPCSTPQRIKPPPNPSQGGHSL